MGALVVLTSAVVGCGRYSFVIRRQYDRGRYGATVARCENESWAANQRWNAGHQARYHVYCGLAYLNLGDSQRAASELVRAEKMRLDDPRLITGRDLARLSGGLMRLFGVPAGQLEIEERPGGTTVAEGPRVVRAPEPPVTVVPPAPVEPPAPPAAPAPPVVSFSAGAGVTGHASVRIVPPTADEPEPPAPPAAPPVDVIVAAPPAPPAPPAAVAAPAAPPVIVIPDEDGAVIQ